MRLSLRLLTKSTAPTYRSKLNKQGAKTPPPLSLEHFLQRQRALGLYRTILRSLFRIPKDGRAEPIAWARGEFERNRNVKDVTQIRYLISTGKTEFEGMSRYVDELAARG